MVHKRQWYTYTTRLYGVEHMYEQNGVEEECTGISLSLLFYGGTSF